MNKRQQLEEALNKLRGYARSASDNIFHHFGEIDQLTETIRGALQDPSEYLPDDMMVVPKEPENYYWYIEFCERKPFKIIKHGSPTRSWVVQENPEFDLSIEQLSSKDTVFCKQFYCKAEAFRCYRIKTAEYLYKAMLSALTKEETE